MTIACRRRDFIAVIGSAAAAAAFPLGARAQQPDCIRRIAVSLPSFGSQRARFPGSHRSYEGATTSHLRIGGRLFCSLPPPT